MMITTKGRYAVMAMLELALSKSSEPVTLAEIAAQQNIPHSYLEQIFIRLKKAGLVSAIKGPGGGYIINSQLDQMTIADIIDAVDENIEMTRCKHQSLNGCMSSGRKCITHNLWHGLSEHIRQYFATISVADMVTNK